MMRTSTAIALLLAAGSVLASDDAATDDAAVQRGSLVFHRYCVLCHGSNADGKGLAAKLYNPKPANLVTSDKNDDYKRLIIRLGGKAIARSESMPAWGKELTEEQITDVVAYLHAIQSSGKSVK